MQGQQHRRNTSLPTRSKPKHVLFSAVVKTDNDPANDTVLKSAPEPGIQTRNVKAAGDGYWPASSGSYNFDTVPTLVKTPWELERPVKRWTWPAKAPVERPRRKPQTEFFAHLPEEICRSILNHVTSLRNECSSGCADCLLHDEHTLLLVSKKWHRATEHHMYDTLWLPGCYHALRIKRRNRLRLLLRTLQERPDLAQRVRRIYAPAVERNKLSDQTKHGLTMDIAEIVLMCPNLQALNGLYPRFCDGSPVDDLTAALATRKKLKEHVWLLQGRDEPSLSLPVFFKCHEQWTNLETLVIWENQPLLETGSMYSLLRSLPALRHLALVGLSPDTFHDGTLHALSGLRSLRLGALPGVSDLGLCQPLPKIAASLEKLSLVDLDIKSLRSLSTALTNFPKLKRLTFVQDGPPGLPLGADITLAVDRPLLVSVTLTYLHWEILVPGSANQALESSIRAGGFPSLRTLRTPCDSSGNLQRLCRPLARKRLRRADVEAYERREAEGYTRDLPHAHIAAQVRLRGSRHTPAVNVVVQEEDDVRYTHVIGQYLGDVRSKIEYSLEPDFEGTNEALSRVADLFDGEIVECVGGKNGRKRHVGMRRRELQRLF